MKAKQFFKNLQDANSFKAMLSESTYRIDIMTDESIYRRKLGTVSTYAKFKELIKDNLHPDVALEIIDGEVEPTAYRRTFKIYYKFEGKTFSLDLFVD